ncbi:MAG: hypothetical protein ACHQ4H_14435, partial [Ktedonobacterales bacterium]
GGEFPVGTSGSVFRAAPWVTEPFAHAVRAAAPRAELRGLLHAPEVAAALLGWQRLREGDTGSWSLGSGKRTIQRGLTVAEAGRLP